MILDQKRIEWKCFRCLGRQTDSALVELPPVFFLKVARGGPKFSKLAAGAEPQEKNVPAGALRPYNIQIVTEVEPQIGPDGQRHPQFPNLVYDLQLQLGLKLVSARSRLTYLVVEHCPERFVAVIAIGVPTRVRINKQVACRSIANPPGDWATVRARWIHFHVIRTLFGSGV